MQIGMTSTKNSLIEMSMTAYWTIRARLLQVPGVANVAIWNERLQLMTVQVEPPKLAEHDVTLDQVMETTADAVDSGLLRFSAGSVIGTGGTIESANQRLPIRNVLPIVTPADLAKVPVKGAAAKNGKSPTLGDVAVVREDHQPLIGDAVVNSEPGILLVVEKLPWANTLQLTAGVEAGHQGAPARAARTSTSTPTSSSRPTSSSWRSPTCPSPWSSASSSSSSS